MPRETFIIDTFDKGIVSGVDTADIQKGAAAWSIDEHPDSIPGTVQPRLTDTAFIDHVDMISMQDSVWVVKEDGKRTLVYYNPSDGTIDSIADFHGSYAITKAHGTPGTGKTPTFDVFNRAVRVGYGKDSSSPVKYCGYVDHGQFGGTAPSAIQYLNAELSKLTTFPHPYKVVGDTDFQYGIEYQGKKIYKISSTTGAISLVSTVEFASLQGICNAQLIMGGSFLYVFDQTNTSYGTLYKIAKSDLSINATYNISGWGTTVGTLSSPGLCTDIELSTNNIWFAIWYGANGFLSATIPANGHGFLFNFAVSSLVDGSSFQPVNVSFKTTVVTPTTVQGELSAVDSSYAFNNSKCPLIKSSEFYAGEIAFLCNITGQFNSSIPIDPNNSIVVMNESMAVANTLASTNCRLVKFSTVGYNNGLPVNTTGLDGFIFGGLTTAVNAFGFNGSGGSANTLRISDIAWGPWGLVTTVSITDGGTGYTALDELTIATGSGTATVEVQTVSSGVVTSVLRLAQGTNYTTGTKATTGGTGTGCTIDVLTVTDQGYQTETVGSTTAKSLIGSMTDCTLSMVATSGVSGTVGFMSSVTTEYGRFYTAIINTTAGTWGTFTKIAQSQAAIRLTSGASPVGLLSSSKKYYYRLVVRYQDYQGSPLYEDTQPETVTPSSGHTSVLVDVYIDSGSVNVRVTDIDVFRAESTTTDSNPTSEYRLVKSCDMRAGWALDSDGAWTTRRRFTFYDTGDYGPTYEKEYGVSETLPNNMLNYNVSCSGAGYIFVTQAYNAKLEQITNVLFRSKRNAPDTFDWSNDYCVLPGLCFALHYFKGFLYAFDNSRMFVVDPETLTVIAEYNGYGISNILAVTSDENGMFFANQDHVFMHDGKTVSIISDAINQVGTVISGATSHRTLAASYTVSLCMMPKFNSLVVGYMGTAAESGQVFVFNFRKQAWYYWVLDSVSGTNITHGAVRRSVFSDYLGNLYFSVSKGVAKICGSGSGKVATWYSKLINLGDETSLKKIYKVIFDGSCTMTIGYDSPTSISTAVTSGSYLTGYTTKRRNFQLKASFTSGQILRGISAIFRRTIGER